VRSQKFEGLVFHSRFGDILELLVQQIKKKLCVKGKQLGISGIGFDLQVTRVKETLVEFRELLIFY